MRQDKRHRLRRRGIYLLPNLFTTLGLFFGFYAVVAAMKGYFDPNTKSHFNQAAMVIFIAMIFDSLDGRIARLTNTSSPFGAEYDSISDMVTFGIAPALLVYSWGLHTLGKFGWLAAFVYVAATALRLARFNTRLDVVSKRFFEGIPSPAAAAVMASMVWTGNSTLALVGTHISIAVAVVTVIMGLLMVSSIPYYSFKELDFKGRVPFVMILIFILLCVAIAVNPPPVLFFGFLVFTLSGPVGFIFGWGRKKKKAKRQVKRVGKRKSTK